MKVSIRQIEVLEILHGASSIAWIIEDKLSQIEDKVEELDHSINSVKT